MDIVREHGKVWGIKKDLAYGVWHITKIYLGEEEKKETPKQKKTKKEED